MVYTNSMAFVPTPPLSVVVVAFTLAWIPSTHTVRSTPLARALGAGGVAQSSVWGETKVPGTDIMPGRERGGGGGV